MVKHLVSKHNFAAKIKLQYKPVKIKGLKSVVRKA